MAIVGLHHLSAHDLAATLYLDLSLAPTPLAGHLWVPLTLSEPEFSFVKWESCQLARPLGGAPEERCEDTLTHWR